MVDIQHTFGALLIGGIIAFILSGIVNAQAFSYFKHYPNDQRTLKLLMVYVWFIDALHTIFVASTLWDHFVAHYGDLSRIDYIPWCVLYTSPKCRLILPDRSLALTVVTTAILTIFVHIFFVYRIFKLSHNNYFVAVPLALLSCVRLCFAFLTTIKMIQLHSISRFAQTYTWAFSSGLALCSILDVLFAGCLCYYLRQNMKKNSSMNDILETLMLYAFENGILNCVASLGTLVCWLTMPQNLIFLGIHFAISKLYANSVMTVINARKDLKQTTHRSQFASSADRNQAIMFPAESFGLTKDTPSGYILASSIG
ncbi:hypothetical protein CVT26_014812 [Gymnopilus dilepis]|uniref:DUF6534 domain-containing protein n=1 Tax=Gymnopilus dilepis TaxID=231916 RepID=A0A409W9Q3_9AGAR|nr:hypothetical protein CVT26_014812 [Gymnopilus dilepis]